MEVIVLGVFGVAAWWGVVLGDSDDEEEILRSLRNGRRRAIVDVTSERRNRAVMITLSPFAGRLRCARLGSTSRSG